MDNNENKGYLVLKPASQWIISILKQQDFVEISNYKLSRFVISVHEIDGLLLYSCLTGELILVNNIENAFPFLVNHGFVVNPNNTEINELMKYQHLARLIHMSSIKGPHRVEILPTTNCNANCFYCYEKGLARTEMSNETAIKVAEFLVKLSRPIHIQWYGGEPLMGISSIETITGILNSQNINYSSSIITNGLLFSNEMINKCTKWNLNHAIITIDGTRSIYNRTKGFNSVPLDPFDTVIHNIHILLENSIKVTIRVNVECHNIEDICLLGEFIRNEFKDVSCLSIMYRALMNTASNNKIESGNRQLIYSSIIREMTKMSQSGIRLYGMMPSCVKGYSCAADKGDTIVILPNGNYCLCSGSISNLQTGKALQNIGSSIELPSFSSQPYSSVCEDCPEMAGCNPISNCLAGKTTLCDIEKRNYIIDEAKLLMRQEYQLYKNTNNDN